MELQTSAPDRVEYQGLAIKGTIYQKGVKIHWKVVYKSFLFYFLPDYKAMHA